MQHVDPRAQLAFKQRVFEDQLWHLARVRPDTVLRPIAGPAWAYRLRARLSVRNVPKKGGVLVGFHERGSSYVADMRECHVLSERVSGLLMPLRALVASLEMRDRMPQIEVAEGGDALALVFRVLDPATDRDLETLRAFARQHRIELWLQPKGPDTVSLLLDGHSGGASRLAYELPAFGVRMPFLPTDFTQVNHALNAVLVERAVRLLDPRPGERVADLFCGLGNFSLPIASRGADVMGIEGSRTLVARAAANAVFNGLGARASFSESNLFEIDAPGWSRLGKFDRVLIDPPREGALAIAKALANDDHRPRRVVYVSCNPATLARDTGVLVHEGGWRLVAAGVVNMFPHTSHVESIAVFEPGDRPERPEPPTDVQRPEDTTPIG